MNWIINIIDEIKAMSYIFNEYNAGRLEEE